MRKVSSSPSVNYKIISKQITSDYLVKSTSCFSEIFRLNDDQFDLNTVIILCNFTTEESQKYIKKYFEILATIFKIEIIYINDDEIEVKGFKSLFYLKSFLTMYRLLFEPASIYDGEDAFLKHLKFFEELCNADFKELDELQQLCTSYQNANIYKGGHCLKSDRSYYMKVASIKDLEEFQPINHQNVTDFFTQIPKII